MRIQALVVRILKQFVRDKRTMALMIVAPILILTMMNLVFSGKDYVPKIGLVQAPSTIQSQLEKESVTLTNYDSASKALSSLKKQKIDAFVEFKDHLPKVTLEGSDPSTNRAVMMALQSMIPEKPQHAFKPHYLHGSESMSSFDNFAPVLLGYFAFFFVFLVAGVSFLRERTSGTLEKLLSSPLRRWEIVVGYVIGFGIFTMIQATIIAAYSIYVLDLMMEGSFLLVLLTTLTVSLTALTLGIFLSAFANNEMQMIQFIPLVIIPQIFFSGLFKLETMSEWLSWIGPFTPLYYAAEALRDIMIRGYGWSDIYLNILLLLGLSLFFIILNIVVLKKYRRI